MEPEKEYTNVLRDLRQIGSGGTYCPLCPSERQPKGEGTWTTGGRYICWACLEELKMLLDERRRQRQEPE